MMKKCMLIAILGLSFAVTGCTSLKSTRIAVNLPEKYNTPDGMVLAKDGSILLNILNSNNPKFPPKIIKIDKNDNITEVFQYPRHPETNGFGALGIDIGPDGNYYVADNQTFFDRNDHLSRLCRVIVKNGKAIDFEVLVEGFIMSNAVSCRTDGVYVTETVIDGDVQPMPSGVYRFSYDEFKGKPIVLAKGGKDKHLIATLYTANEDWKVGANGLGFDKKGNMYVCNFGEQSIEKFTFDKNGKVTSQEVFAKGQGMKSTDGLKIHPVTNDIYVADFVGNAVHKIDINTGKVTTIAKNANNTGGIGGLLDKPSEVCIRDGKLYIANIDLSMDGNEHDAPHTISVLNLN
ncbi:MAG: SMP-30/gluconolactonase/LRE family protein [Phycisphaerae bacterium]|nr:SMP-30/gluconolactonase/LRE family protein [Phycisphaerae bacterium]